MADVVKEVRLASGTEGADEMEETVAIVSTDCEVVVESAGCEGAVVLSVAMREEVVNVSSVDEAGSVVGTLAVSITVLVMVTLSVRMLNEVVGGDCGSSAAGESALGKGAVTLVVTTGGFAGGSCGSSELIEISFCAGAAMPAEIPGFVMGSSSKVVGLAIGAATVVLVVRTGTVPGGNCSSSEVVCERAVVDVGTAAGVVGDVCGSADTDKVPGSTCTVVGPKDIGRSGVPVGVGATPS